MASTDETRRIRRRRRWLDHHTDIRLDANEAWNAAEVIQRTEPLLEYGISSVEQPVPHEEVSVLSELRRQLPVRVMLGESLTSPTDAKRAIDSDTCDLFNIRLSKCGGFLGSLRLAARPHSAGLGYQLGCHPGESGILSAAGRHFATSVADIAHLEGSYDRHILQEQLTHEDVTFGYGGRATALMPPRLGVTVNPHSLQRLTSLCQTFTSN